MATRPPLRTISTASSSHSTDYPTAAAAPPGGVPKSITALLNNPLPSASSGSYWLLWPPSTSLPDAPPVPSHPCEVSRTDFAPYLAAVADTFTRFADIRLHANTEIAASDDGDPTSSSTSSGFAACLRKVPALFFKEDFALEEGATFEAACPLGDGALQERLGQHLDVVEAHLVQEIARRFVSFYEEQGRLRGLDGEIVSAVGGIRELREVVRVLTGDLVGDAQQVQELNATRDNLIALQEKLTIILYVSQALTALRLEMARKCYVVYIGRVPGVYEEWKDCQKQVNNFSDNNYQGYESREVAKEKWRRHGRKKWRNFLVITTLLLFMVGYVFYFI